MARNTLAGKRTGKSRTAKYYAANPKARRKRKRMIVNTILLQREKNTEQNLIRRIKSVKLMATKIKKM